MSKISRRGLFGLGAGAAVVPFIKPAPVEAALPVEAPWQVFTANGVWIKPGPKKIEIVAVSGGGGAGGYYGPLKRVKMKRNGTITIGKR